MLKRARLGLNYSVPSQQRVDLYDDWMSPQLPAPVEYWLSFITSFVRTGAMRNLSIITIDDEDCLGMLIEEGIAGNLPSLRTLCVEGGVSPSPKISTAFPRLTLLALQVWDDETRIPLSPEEDIIFETLKSFQLAVVGRPSNLSLFHRWQLPQLRHLEIAIGDIDQENYATCLTTKHLCHFLRTAGYTQLTSLKFSAEVRLMLSTDLWEVLPRLKYLGVGIFSPNEGSPSIAPPSKHPLRTLAHFDNRNIYGIHIRSEIWREIKHWNNLHTVADSHEWVTIAPRERNPNKAPFSHGYTRRRNIGTSLLCEECIWDLLFVCTQRGLRYEDRWGQSWEKYQQQVEKRQSCSTSK